MQVVIVGKSGCPRCDQAKQLCDMNEISFEYKKIHEDIQLEELEQIVGGRVSSVPQIYISEHGLNTYIGGYIEFDKYVKANSFSEDDTELEVL